MSTGPVPSLTSGDAATLPVFLGTLTPEPVIVLNGTTTKKGDVPDLASINALYVDSV